MSEKRPGPTGEHTFCLAAWSWQRAANKTSAEAEGGAQALLTQGLDAGASHWIKAPTCLWGGLVKVTSASMPARFDKTEVFSHMHDRLLAACVSLGQRTIDKDCSCARPPWHVQDTLSQCRP